MAREPNPDDAAQQRDAVAHLLEQLEDEERRILELRLSGYEPCEIAAALRTEPNNVRVRLHRLRVRLQGRGIAADRV
jgi:DNA-directed RNA polymerase specialized sigma24 family protein